MLVLRIAQFIATPWGLLQVPIGSFKFRTYNCLAANEVEINVEQNAVYASRVKGTIRLASTSVKCLSNTHHHHLPFWNPEPTISCSYRDPCIPRIFSTDSTARLQFSRYRPSRLIRKEVDIFPLLR